MNAPAPGVSFITDFTQLAVTNNGFLSVDGVSAIGALAGAGTLSIAASGQLTLGTSTPALQAAGKVVFAAATGVIDLFSSARGDFDQSGIIDLGDFNTWFSHVGASLPLLTPQSSALTTPSPIPEPTTLALLLLPLLTPRRHRPSHRS